MPTRQPSGCRIIGTFAHATTQIVGSRPFADIPYVQRSASLPAVDLNRSVDDFISGNAKEFRRWLAAHGCTFETKAGGSGHIIVRKGDKITDLPIHGGGKELGTGLVNAIKKQLGLK